MIIESVYAALLSDKALKWLADNAVIITESRAQILTKIDGNP